MKYPEELQRRHDALMSQNQENMRELIVVLAQRAKDRAEGREDPELARRTIALSRKARETQRDYLRLRADMIEHDLKTETAPADPFKGLTIPDFMPGKDL